MQIEKYSSTTTTGLFQKFATGNGAQCVGCKYALCKKANG